MEQVKADVAYSHTNVKLIGISGGISYGALGMTHHSAQDIAAGVYSKEIFQAVRRSRFLPGMEAALRRKKREGWKQAVETLLTRPGTK